MSTKMMMINQYRPDVANDLGKEITDLIGDAIFDNDTSVKEVLAALAHNIGVVIGAIQCADCQRRTARAVTENLLPNVLTHAMQKTRPNQNPH